MTKMEIVKFACSILVIDSLILIAGFGGMYIFLKYVVSAVVGN